MPYVAKRPIKIGEEIRQIGDPIPEADEWLRVESWVRNGHLTMVAELPKPTQKAKIQRTK